MKIIEYSEVSSNLEIKLRVDSMLFQNGFYPHLTPWLIEFFSLHNPRMSVDTEKAIALKLSSQLSSVSTALNGNVRGMRILDLGSGSNGNTEDGNSSFYEPWLCRILHELGASPIGVDYGEFKEEPFGTKQANLLVPDSLSFIDDDSIDLAHARQLFNSPQLELLTTGLGWGHGSPTTGENLARILKPHIERVLKPNGTLLHYTDLNQYGISATGSPGYRGWPFNSYLSTITP